MPGEDIKLNEMELDAIGEVMNISMGSAATAMSTMLDRKVNITTPRIEFLNIEDFNFSFLEPVVGVLIKYVEGIDGSNVLLLRQTDVNKIVGSLLSMDPEEMGELDEMGISAICEIMNQMMGSSASALATFLGESVNISPPEIMDTAKQENVRELFALSGDSLVSIRFNLIIEGLVESEFMSAMEPQLAKDIVARTMGEYVNGGDDPVPEAAPAAPPEPTPQPMQPEQAAPAPMPEMAPPPTAPMPDPMQMQTAPMPMQPQPMQAAPPPMQTAPPMQMAPPQPQPVPRVQTTPYSYQSFDGEYPVHEQDNFELVMGVPIQISVELGRTKRKIKDIADLSVGNIVELDRQAGDQVDVIANGRLIARGDVVVVDDNYSVRITEIVKEPEEFV